MIEVIIRHPGTDIELGYMTIENLSDVSEEFGDYSVRFGVDRNESVGIHQRAIHKFPRRKYNVFGLVLQALSTLEPSELELDGDLKASSIRRKRLGWRAGSWSPLR